MSEQLREEALRMEVISHVRGCPNCGRYQAALRVWEQGIELLRQETAPEPSSTFWREFEARLNKDKGYTRWSFEEIMERLGRRVIWATGIVVALLTLGLALVGELPSGTDSLRLDAEAHLSRTFVLESAPGGNDEVVIAQGEEMLGFWMDSNPTEKK